MGVAAVKKYLEKSKPFKLNLYFQIIVTSGFLMSYQAAQAQDGNIQRLNLGFFTSSGSYGNLMDTDFSVFNLGYEEIAETWSFNVDVPYLSMEGPGDVLFRSGRTGLRRGASFFDEQGLGDISLGANYYLPGTLHDWQFDLGLQLKLPTGDEVSGLGSGATDVSLQMGVYKTFEDISLFGNLGYANRGSSTLYQLENGAFYSIGGNI